MIDFERLEVIDAAKRELQEVERNMQNAVQPTLQDISMVEPVHEHIKQMLDGVRKADTLTIKIIVLLYCFSPMSLVRNCRKSVTLRAIAKTLGMSYQNFIQHKQSVVLTYKVYAPIRTMANLVYDSVCEEFCKEKV
jgi:hypothetical protein